MQALEAAQLVSVSMVSELRQGTTVPPACVLQQPGQAQCRDLESSSSWGKQLCELVRCAGSEC